MRFGHFVEDRCLHDPRLDDGHPDVERLDLLRQRLAQRLERELGGRVASVCAHGNAAADRGHVDDASTPALAHRRQHCLNATERAEVVGLHGLPKDVERQVLDGAERENPSIVDEHIDVTTLGQHLPDGLHDRLVAVHIETQDRDGQRFLARDGLQFGRAGRVAHGGVDVVAGAGECHRRGEAKARARAGNEHCRQ